MRQHRVYRLIASKVLTAGQPETFEIPRGYDIEHIGLRLAGSVVVATGHTSVRAEAPCQLLPRVELIADGRNTICSIPFALLNLANPFRRGGQLPTRTPPSAASAATYAVEASGILDQALIDGVRPKDTNLRTSGMQLLQLRVTVGAAQDMFVVGAGASSLSSMTLQVWTSELIEVAEAGEVLTTPIALIKRSYQDIAFTASNANMEIPLPVGNSMRGVILRAEGSATAGEPSNAVINNVILRSGVDVRLNLPAPVLRELNRQSYSPGAQAVGVYVADLMHMGAQGGVRLTEGWDLSRASEAKLVLDVTGATNTKVQVCTIEALR